MPLDVGSCDGYRVEILHAELVRVGCQVLAPREWAKRWRTVARKHDVDEADAAAAFEWMTNRIEELAS